MVASLKIIQKLVQKLFKTYIERFSGRFSSNFEERSDDQITNSMNLIEEHNKKYQFFSDFQIKPENY